MAGYDKEFASDADYEDGFVESDMARMMRESKGVKERPYDRMQRMLAARDAAKRTDDRGRGVEL